jgi:hypothetical protein
VFNGRQVVLRTEDPIDLNGNGAADDNLFIRAFIPDEMFLTPDLKLYIVVDAKAAVGTQPSVGKVFMVKQLVRGGCSADFNGSQSVNATDIFAFLDAWFAQNGQNGPGLSADFNGSQSVNATDIFAFLDAWFAQNGQPC